MLKPALDTSGAGPRIRRLNGGLWQLSGPRIHDERHQRPYPRVEEDRAHDSMKNSVLAFVVASLRSIRQLCDAEPMLFDPTIYGVAGGLTCPNQVIEAATDAENDRKPACGVTHPASLHAIQPSLVGRAGFLPG